MSLLKVNAGKVLYDEATHKCTPLAPRGVITVRPSADEESFFDFKWTPKLQSTGAAEADDLLLIPGDVTVKPVASCKSGRVFALTFLSSGAKHLYWLQDVGDDDELAEWTARDKSLLAKLSELIQGEEEEEVQPEVKNNA